MILWQQQESYHLQCELCWLFHVWTSSQECQPFISQRFTHDGMAHALKHFLNFLLPVTSLDMLHLFPSLTFLLFTFLPWFYPSFFPLTLKQNTQAHLCCTHTDPPTPTHTHTHTQTVQSSTPHVENNFIKVINPGVKKYSISTAPCCVPCHGLGHITINSIRC